MEAAQAFIHRFKEVMVVHLLHNVPASCLNCTATASACPATSICICCFECGNSKLATPSHPPAAHAAWQCTARTPTHVPVPHVATDPAACLCARRPTQRPCCCCCCHTRLPRLGRRQRKSSTRRPHRTAPAAAALAGSPRLPAPSCTSRWSGTGPHQPHHGLAGRARPMLATALTQRWRCRQPPGRSSWQRSPGAGRRALLATGGRGSRGAGWGGG